MRKVSLLNKREKTESGFNVCQQFCCIVSLFSSNSKKFCISFIISHLGPCIFYNVLMFMVHAITRGCRVLSLFCNHTEYQELFQFLFLLSFVVFQSLVYFREVTMSYWIECVFFDSCVNQYVCTCQIHQKYSMIQL